MKIRAGDNVVVITGKDKGKTGSVLRVLATTHRVVVAGINMRTKHVRATPQRPGQRLQYEASIHMSNIMLIDPKTKKRTRVGFAVSKGKKDRIAKRSGEVIARTLGKPAAAKDEKALKTEGKKAKPAAKPEKGGVTKVEKPERKPFWKKVGFGAEEAAESLADRHGLQKTKDHSVPDEGQAPTIFTHQRGE